MRQYLLLLPIALVSAGIIGAGIVVAQQPPAQPADAGQEPAVTFRTEINFVEVHAIVTDEDGAFVRGLTADDFEIYEDGRLQAPAVFSLIDVPIERPFTPRNADAPIEPDVRATTRTFDGRLYILLLDDLHTYVTRTNNVREVARGFIDEYLGVGDLAAVLFTSGRRESAQELTSSRRLLTAAIDRFQGRKLPSAGVEKLALHVRRASVPTEDERGNPTPIRTVEGLQDAQAIVDPLDQQRAFNVRRALQSIENISEWLADVQGRRKALLFFSEGFDYDIYQPFYLGRQASSVIADTREATAAAQRANVNVYGIDPRGLSNFGEMMEVTGSSDYPQLGWGEYRGALDELLLAQESLLSLSEETGGLAIVNSGDLAGGLGRIVLDNSRYYLLGYYSDATEWSRNRFMDIEVRVKRPGLEVRARKGFLPPDTRAIEPPSEAEVAFGTSPALTAALGKPIPVGDLPLRVFAAPLRGSDDNASVLVALEIDGPSLRFEERDGRFAESIEVSIVAVDERVRMQGGDRQTFDLNLMPETHERVSRTGVRTLTQLDLPPGRYQIRVGVHETTGLAIATVAYDLEVPDYSEMPFALSGVLLTSSAADLFATANQDANDGRTLVQSRDSRMVEAGAGRQAHGFTTSFPLRDLDPGMYVLRVDASTTIGGHSARHDILFEVQ